MLFQKATSPPPNLSSTIQGLSKAKQGRGGKTFSNDGKHLTQARKYEYRIKPATLTFLPELAQDTIYISEEETPPPPPLMGR